MTPVFPPIAGVASTPGQPASFEDVPGDRRPPRQTIVCTLGMHRSGTSLVSRLLNLLGVDLGPEDAMAPLPPYNARGLWEHLALVRVNDEILAAFGGTWDRPPVFPAHWLDDARLAPATARARAIVDRQFSGGTTWGWKDPRTCVTLPFWHRLLGPMRHVICVRNPLAVMASLHCRDRMPAAQAEALWLGHVHAALAHTSGHPRLVVFYDDMLADWPRQLRRLARFVGQPHRADDPAVIAAAADFVDAALCHHQVTDLELAHASGVSSITATLFLALRSLAADAVPSGDLARDRAGRTMEALAARAVREWTEQRNKGADLERVALESAHAHATLHEIRTSVAWSLVCRARAAIVRLLPDGTSRRARFHEVMRRIARSDDRPDLTP
jgi:hypothetical protein